MNRSNDKKRQKKPMSAAMKAVIIVICVLLAAGIGLAIKFAIDIDQVINDPASVLIPATPAPTATPDPTPDPTQEATAAPTEAPTPSPTPDPETRLLSEADLEFMKNRVNLLVLGVDESTERASWGSFRTDTMMLVSIDFDTNDIDIISVPRDSFVRIYDQSGEAQELIPKDGYVRCYDPDGCMDKINSAFAHGGGAQKNGFDACCKTVSMLLGGIPVHYYVGFNMNVVKDVVNAIGGIDYDVDIEVSMNGRFLHPGMQHLDGQGVLDYCRMRKGSSDIARVDRQQRIIIELLRQMKANGTIGDVPAIYSTVQQNVATSLTTKQIAALALMALDVDMDNVARYTIEGKGMYVEGRSCWAIDNAKLIKLVDDVFGVNITPDPGMDAAYLETVIAENAALLYNEINAANAAIARSNELRTTYKDYLDSSARSALKSAEADVQSAVDAGVKELIDQYTAVLNALCDSASASIVLPEASPTAELIP